MADCRDGVFAKGDSCVRLLDVAALTMEDVINVQLNPGHASSVFPGALPSYIVNANKYDY